MPAYIYIVFVFMTRNSSNTNTSPQPSDIISAFDRLSIRQHAELSDLLQRHREEQQTLRLSQSPQPSHSDRSLPYSGPNPNTAPNHPLSANGLPLRIGDRVSLRTKANIGRKGDLAHIIGKEDDGQWILIRLIHNNKTTKRRPRNLTVIYHTA